MNDFKKNSRFSRDSKPGGFSRPSFGGSGARRAPGRAFGNDQETFKTSCSKCHAACEVPFRPNGKKPVFCKNCFVRDDARPSGSSYEQRSYGPERSFAPRSAAPVEDPRIGQMQKELAAVHTKLDTLIQNLNTSAYASILATSAAKEEKPKKVAPVKKTVKKAKKA